MKALLCWLFFLLAVVSAEEPGWKTYSNARFGFSVQLPAELQGSREPDNGAGREFHTKNGEFSILAHAHFLGVADENESLDSRWKETLKELGDTVIYKKKAASWYVVSGTDAKGIEYYYKFHVQEKNWAEIRITYPHAKNRLYDPWVEKISRSFVPFLKGDFDRTSR